MCLLRDVCDVVLCVCHMMCDVVCHVMCVMLYVCVSRDACDVVCVCVSRDCSLMNEVVHTSPTIGSNVEEVVYKNFHFIMWDIGGQESLRASWNTYYANTEVSQPAHLLH